MAPSQATISERVLRALLGSTLLCALFYGYRLHQLGEVALSYLPWNLLLAWIPLGLSLGLVALLRRRRWSDWLTLLLTLVWVLFLPNSFYLVSDFIHLQEVATTNVLYDAVMFTVFVFTGLLLGFSSLYLVHRELLKRLPTRSAALVVAGLLLVCSFAIYIGRDLRWNSWDVLVSPAGLLFDLSNRVTQPTSWNEMFSTVAIFFALLGGMYYTGRQLLSDGRPPVGRDSQTHL